jgi:hypothetical protein
MTKFLKILLLYSVFLFTIQPTLAQISEEEMFEFKSVTGTEEVKAELFLLKNFKFCIVRYTDKDNNITGGVYFLSNDSLYLTFKPKIVTLGVHGKFRFYLREKNAELPNTSFQVIKGDPEQIKGRLYDEALPFAMRGKRSGEQMRINDLLDTPEWKVLEGKSVRDLKREWKRNGRRTK